MTTSDQRPDHRTVSIPEDVYDRVERRLARTRFETVDEYVAEAMEGVLREVERGADGDEDRSETPDADAVEQRLQSLGYIE